MAILLMRKVGRPAGSSAKGIKEPKGNPGCFRESVDKVATEARDTRVRTRSAWLGSGTCGTAGPVDACWRSGVVSFSDIGFLPSVQGKGSIELNQALCGDPSTDLVATAAIPGARRRRYRSVLLPKCSRAKCIGSGLWKSCEPGPVSWMASRSATRIVDHVADSTVIVQAGGDHVVEA